MRRKSGRVTSLAAIAAIALTPLIGGAVPVVAADIPAPPPTPRAECGPGSRPEPDVQGRAPLSEYESGSAQKGFFCNLEEIGAYGNRGGYKVHRYVDKAGRECAYMDSTLLAPTGIINGTDLTGTYVLDMSDPANPVKTANLLTPAMQSPHESMELNQARGLLVANMGYPTYNPGFVDVYDVSADCRHPVLKSSTPLGVFGHESGFAPDGRTFYSGANNTITALALENPAVPEILWVSRDHSPHGMRLSADGTRLYIADLSDGLVILDVSEIQARKEDPEVREVGRLEWDEMSIPQVAIPVTIKGKPYLIEIDEFATNGESQIPQSTADAVVGAARIIDISDETKPKIVSHIRLEVNNPEGRSASAGDPGASSPIQGYTGHYCSVPRNEEPGIVACTFVASGLRVFDIRDPLRPREIAYFNKPVGGNNPTSYPNSYAMSASAFVPERGELWYLDGNSGLHVLRFTNGVWTAASAGSTGAEGASGAVAGGQTGGTGTLPATGAPAAIPAASAVAALIALALRRHVRDRNRHSLERVG